MSSWCCVAILIVILSEIGAGYQYKESNHFVGFNLDNSAYLLSDDCKKDETYNTGTEEQPAESCTEMYICGRRG